MKRKRPTTERGDTGSLPGNRGSQPSRRHQPNDEERLNDLEMEGGDDIMITFAMAEMWTGWLDDVNSEVWKSKHLSGQVFKVIQVRRFPNYTQVMVRDRLEIPQSEPSEMLVVINVWCRYNLKKKATGLVWAHVQQPRL